jgi:hypothetical protein
MDEVGIQGERNRLARRQHRPGRLLRRNGLLDERLGRPGDGERRAHLLMHQVGLPCKVSQPGG